MERMTFVYIRKLLFGGVKLPAAGGIAVFGRSRFAAHDKRLAAAPQNMAVNDVAEGERGKKQVNLVTQFFPLIMGQPAAAVRLANGWPAGREARSLEARGTRHDAVP